MLRFFVSSRSEPSVTRDAGDASCIDHVLAVLALHPRAREPAEWIVGIDYTSELHIVPMSERARLPATAQSELAFHEIAFQERARASALRLDADELWLLGLELLEQAPDAPGLDDPVYLYGRLVGPLPPAPGAPIRAAHGQLTIARSDLLDGLATGLERPFVCPSTTGAGRCAGALVPGDRSDALANGRGVVLAIPVLPADLGLPSAANEVLVAQLLYDVLVAMQEDVRGQGIAGGFASRALPVPSRRALEQRLVLQGYTIEGDVAIKREGTGLASTIAGLFGTGDRIALPPEAGADELARIAREVLSKLSAWPTPRAIALRKLTCSHERGALQAGTVHPPRASAAAPRVPRHTTSVARSEWMKDFVEAHRKPGKPAPRLTPMRPTPLRPTPLRPTPKPDARPGSSTPEWMEDFEAEVDPGMKPTSATKVAKDRATGGEAARDDEPDWMKDFD